MEIVVDLNGVVRNNPRDPASLLPVSPNGITLQNYYTVSQPGYWCWYRQHTEKFHHHKDSWPFNAFKILRSTGLTSIGFAHEMKSMVLGTNMGTYI